MSFELQAICIDRYSVLAVLSPKIRQRFISLRNSWIQNSWYWNSWCAIDAETDGQTDGQTDVQTDEVSVRHGFLLLLLAAVIISHR